MAQKAAWCPSAVGCLRHMWERKGTCVRGSSISWLWATSGSCRALGMNTYEGGSKGCLFEGTIPPAAGSRAAPGTSLPTLAEHKTPSRLLQLMRKEHKSQWVSSSSLRALCFALAPIAASRSCRGARGGLARTRRSRSAAVRAYLRQTDCPKAFSC